MAALTAGQIMQQWSSGGSADVAGLFAITNVTAGDTADLAQWFSSVKRGVYLGATSATGTSCTVTGTAVTVPAGPAGDAGYVLAYGTAALAS